MKCAPRQEIKRHYYFIAPQGRWQAVRHVVPGVIKQHKPEQVTGVILALICFSSVNLMLTFRARGQGKVAASDAGKRNFACLKCTVFAKPMKLATNNNKKRNYS